MRHHFLLRSSFLPARCRALSLRGQLRGFHRAFPSIHHRSGTCELEGRVGSFPPDGNRDRDTGFQPFGDGKRFWNKRQVAHFVVRSIVGFHRPSFLVLDLPRIARFSHQTQRRKSDERSFLVAKIEKRRRRNGISLERQKRSALGRHVDPAARQIKKPPFRSGGRGGDAALPAAVGHQRGVQLQRPDVQAGRDERGSEPDADQLLGSGERSFLRHLHPADGKSRQEVLALVRVGRNSVLRSGPDRDLAVQ